MLSYVFCAVSLRVNGFRFGGLGHWQLGVRHLGVRRLGRMIRVAAITVDPRYGSIDLSLAGRHAGFGALRCGYAYSGWICFDGWLRPAAKGAGFVIGVVVVVVINLVGIATSDVLNRLA